MSGPPRRKLLSLRKGVYHVSFMVHGQRIRRSLKTGNRRQAERAAARIYADATAGLVLGDALPLLPKALAEAFSGLATKADLAALAAQMEAGFAALAVKLDRTAQQEPPGAKNGFALSPIPAPPGAEFDDVLAAAAAAKAQRRAAKIRTTRPAPRQPRRPS